MPQVGVNAHTGSPYQALLEAESTADRLRLAVQRLRTLRKQVGAA